MRPSRMARSIFGLVILMVFAIQLAPGASAHVIPDPSLDPDALAAGEISEFPATTESVELDPDNPETHIPPTEDAVPIASAWADTYTDDHNAGGGDLEGSGMRDCQRGEKGYVYYKIPNYSPATINFVGYYNGGGSASAHTHNSCGSNDCRFVASAPGYSGLRWDTVNVRGNFDTKILDAWCQ